MNRFFLIFIIISAIIFLASCDGGSDEKCDPGYTWKGSECEKDNVIVIPDKDELPVDKDTANDEDSVEVDIDDMENDSDSNSYMGDCTEILQGGSYEINIETKTLTIGKITLNGNTDNDNLFGELWAENKTTLSEFKIADISASLTGKKYKFPKGRYNFLFRAVSSDNRINILENIDLESGDRTLDFDLPLYHFTGSVQKNSGAFTVDAGMESATFLTIKSGSYEKIIPYSSFGSFDIVIPKSKYSVLFEGQLASGQPVFKGTVLSLENGIEIGDDINQAINVETVTYSGNAVNEGYDVQTGQLILVENPPFDSLSAVIIPALSSKSYSVTVTKGLPLNVLYLPETDSYPVKYIKLEIWDDFSSDKAHDIILDFGRIHGTVTFLGNATLPSISKCTEADCTRGKLRIAGFDYSSLIVKDFGVTGDDMTYEALVVRGTKNVVPDPVEGDPDHTKIVYNPKTYNMNFESHLNNVEGAFKYSPFTVPLKYLNSQSVLVSNFNLLNISEEPILEKELNFNIAPMVVSGTVTLNGTAITTEKEDLIKLRDLNGIETPVINISDLTDGSFSFLVPTGEYDVIYEGEGVLGSEFRTFIERNINVNGNLTGQNFGLTTSKIILDFTVNGTPFKEWVENRKDIDEHFVVINPDKTAANYTINPVKQTDNPYYIELLNGLTVNAYLDLVFVNPEKTQRSFSRIPLLISHTLSSDKKADAPVKITDFSTSVKLNGKAITGATNYIAQFKIQGQNRSEIYYPASGTSVKAMFKSGELKSPSPEIILNDGFDTKQSIELDCIYFGE